MSKIRIEKCSITNAGTDCIVNAANEQLMGGSGVCGAIFKAAGWNQLQNACNAIGHCDTGSAVITPAFNLNAKYIIHAVGPIWHDGKHQEPQKLYGCYQASLKLAKENGCHSIAFPLISAGIYGYPKDKAWKKALQSCNDFIQKNPDYNIDILFAVLDNHILQMGLYELKKQAANSKSYETSKNMDDYLLEKLDGKKLRAAIENVRKAGIVKWNGGKQSDDTIQIPSYEYPKGVWDSLFVFSETDTDYMKHYKAYCDGVLPSEMNVQQIWTMLTYLSRGEHFCTGFLKGYVDNKDLLKYLLRLDDLLIRYYQKHNLPEDMRYHNPLFWYEMDQNQNPVLIKGNGEKLTINEKSNLCDQTVQSQQGWQRARLFMDLNGIWDATGFGASMRATYAFGPDEDGKCFTFTSCEEAERSLYAILTSEQVITCRKNVDDFYSDKKVQMEWNEVILHPVCVVLRKDGSLEPVAINALNSHILDQYKRKIIEFRNPDSYRRIFRKAK